uniref:uncharacterized protein n=1 Tax=Centroberyx gerrardi TaxID=166262 RepID=UPI003AACB1EF
MGVRKSDMQQSHVSDPIELTVHTIPYTDLTASPSRWLRVRDSVTLSCEVDRSSKGWKYYWYRAVPYKDGLPSSSIKSLSMEMLPGSQHGAGGSLSFSPVGLNHIKAYVCRAGRGDPAYYTRYSIPQLLWVSGSSPSATLRVSPNRVQHFDNDAYSVSCEGHGNSTGWKVKRFTWSKGKSECGTGWGTVTGSSCYINTSTYDSIEAIYWCQSDSGEYSDAANISQTTKPVILESPILPVTEGNSVKLGCRYVTPPSDLGAGFYRYDSLISSERTGEMIIQSVSRSDEGSYRCEHPVLGESRSSWLSVRGVSVLGYC